MVLNLVHAAVAVVVEVVVVLKVVHAAVAVVVEVVVVLKVVTMVVAAVVLPEAVEMFEASTSWAPQPPLHQQQRELQPPQYNHSLPQ